MRRSRPATWSALAVVGACLLLAACAPQPGATQAPGARTVSGRVTAGPTCPVERDPPDPACADRPVAGARLVVRDAAGATVAELTSGADGRFSLRLAPGAYTLDPQPVTGLLGTAAAIPFEVVAESDPAPLEVSYDTGIR